MKNENLNNLLAAIVESSDDAILSKTLDGIILSWNRAAEKLFGYTADEMIGQSIIKIFPSELKYEFDGILKKIRSGERIEQYETIRVRKDGRRINISLKISPIIDEEGKITGALAIARNVDGKKILGSEHEKKERQLALTQKIAKLGYWEWDLLFGRLEWSDELYKIYGLKKSAEEISLENYFEIIHPEDRSDVRKVIDSSLITLLPFKADYRILLPNKVIRYIHEIGEVFVNGDQKPVKINAVAQDVSEYKRIERRLTSQFEVTRLLAESKNLPEAAPKILEVICEGVDWLIGELWLADYDSNLLHLVGSWHKEGINAEEFIEISRKCKFGPGVSLQGQVWEKQAPIWSTHAVDDQFFPRAALAAKLKLHTALAFPIVCKKKVIGVVAFYKDDITEPDDELLEMFDSLGKQIGDFIERKQSEPALKESEGVYKTLVEISPDSITYTDLSGKIIFCNQQTAELFGFNSIEEIIGQNIYAFIASEDQKHAIENEHKIIETGKTRNIEYSLIQKDGTKFPAEINTSIVLDADGKPKAFIGVIRNISVRKKTEKEINIRIRQQAAIAELGQQALVGTEIHKLLDNATELVSKTLDLEYCELLELLPDDKSLLLTSGTGWKTGSVGSTIVNAGIESHAGQTLLSNQPVISENYESEKRFRPSDLLIDHNVVSGITVLIHGRNKPFGVLGAHSSKPKVFSKNDSHFLQAIANVIAAAIDRKKVEEELAQSLNLSRQNQLQAEENKKKLSFLAEASRIFNSSLDYHQTLSGVANLLTPELSDWCVIDLLQDDGTLKHVAISHKDPQKMEIANELEKKYKHNLDSFRRVYHVVRTGKSEFYSFIRESLIETSTHKDEYMHFINEFGVKSAMIVPLKLRDKVLGVISFISTKPDYHYSNFDLAFAEDIASRAASAIENARLYREANLLNLHLDRKTKEQKDELKISNTELEVEIKLRRKIIEELEAKVQRQANLFDLSLAAFKLSDMTSILQSAVQLTASIPGSKKVGLFEYNNEKNKIVLRAGIGWGFSSIGTIEIDIDSNSIEGFTLLNNEPIIFSNFFQDKKFRVIDEPENETAACALCALIAVSQKPYGVLSVYFSNNECSKDDRNFLLGIVKFLSLLIEMKSN